MNIMLIAQCNKKALNETRRILDQFAERKGDRVWQTPITQIGLDTLRKMLKKSARRNTAVACHKIGGKNHSELLWIVGNVRKFNRDGTVPTNSTMLEVIQNQDEDTWNTLEDMAIVASIAALFHDFGKANTLFQKKLKGKGDKSEPYRHEWVSLRMFQAFVNQRDDKTWLEALENISCDDEEVLLQELNKIQDEPENFKSRPFPELPNMAQAVAWLIVTHHKLPQSPGKNEDVDIQHIEKYILKHISPKWNSPQIQNFNGKITKEEKTRLEEVWRFPKGTPLQSKSWCAKAHNIAKRALKRTRLLPQEYLDDIFTLHVSRLALMFADHYFSSQDGNPTYRDKRYKPIANTDRETGKPKQHLDEHLIGVYRHTLQFIRLLPTLKRALPSITRHAAFKRRSRDKKFRWQDNAYEMACAIKLRTKQQGFFGVNLASTGCGKTFANARIMYALADEKLGCRFSVALGLRTLTLQTGDAFREKLHLDDDDLAVLIGSSAVKQLHEAHQKFDKVVGSESANELMDEHLYVRYEGSLLDHALQDWLSSNPKLNRLLSSPVLVSTIDHLMPATEGTRGGKQIVPMLRLLTSDLVLDEPDDFGLNDLPALARLCHWAGLLGSRVLLSSATLSSELVGALFKAYQAGRLIYNKAHFSNFLTEEICCAWIDENDACAQSVCSTTDFLSKHGEFIQKRVDRLMLQEPIRRAELLPVVCEDDSQQKVIQGFAQHIYHAAIDLHHNHGIYDKKEETSLSVGLVRMANIDPLVAVAQRLIAMAPPENTHIHYCIYHSQFPLIVRSGIETNLDNILNRKDEQRIWEIPHIDDALRRHPAKHHIFIVIGSPVTEVGRDHDYDWAIVEPSSMRSIVQLAGRIQRHRKKVPSQANILLMQENIKALGGRFPAFTKPGFEDKTCLLKSHDLSDVLDVTQYQDISSIPSIQTRENMVPHENLVDLEHSETQRRMDGDNADPHALQWLRPHATLTGELQRRTRFRAKTGEDDDYFLYLEDEDEEIVFKRWHESGEAKVHNDFNLVDISPVDGVSLWGVGDYRDLLCAHIEHTGEDIAKASQVFGAVSLRQLSNNRQWRYSPVFGFYRALE